MLKCLRVTLCLLFILFSKSNAVAGWDFMFSNKKYSNNIEIRTYLMNRDQISSEILNNKVVDIRQKTYQELKQDIVYLVVQLKNKGHAGAWGVLDCQLYANNLKIYIPHLSPGMDKWKNYIISVEGSAWPRKGGIPKITIEWSKLYTK